MGSSSSVPQPPVKGQFNATSTSTEVANEYGSSFRGKHAIVTGSNCGIGLNTVKVLVQSGAKVILACRSEQNGIEAIHEIKKEIPNADVVYMQLDLASLQSVRSFVGAYKATKRPLHLLINNAGVMACPKSFTADGFEMQLGVNHLGHFVLTMELLPLLIQSGSVQEPARIVNVSSVANIWHSTPEGIAFDDLDAKRAYHSWHRNGASKMANILFTDELQRRLQANNHPVLVNSLHPGSIPDSKLARHMNNFSTVMGIFYAMAQTGNLSAIFTSKMKTIPQGKYLMIFYY